MLTASNAGNVTLTGVTVSDPKLGSLVCTPPQPATLAPGEQMVCTGTYTLTQADIDAGRVDNTGTADSDQTSPTDAPNQVPVTQVPALTLVKQGALDMTVVAPADRADAGDRVVYTLTATNVGNVDADRRDGERSEARRCSAACRRSRRRWRRASRWSARAATR